MALGVGDFCAHAGYLSLRQAVPFAVYPFPITGVGYESMDKERLISERTLPGSICEKTRPKVENE